MQLSIPKTKRNKILSCFRLASGPVLSGTSCSQNSTTDILIRIKSGESVVHNARVRDMQIAYKMSMVKSEGRARHRMGYNTNVAENRKPWRALADTKINFRIS